jgi:hypothetical protein
LSARVLNIYKNFWEDQWWNKLINRISYSYLVIKRYGYLYFKDGNGAGDFKSKTKAQRDNMIHEFIYFLYFDYEYLPKEDDKQSIINLLHKYNETENDVNLNWFKTKFYILDALLNILIKDPYIKIEDKIFINQLLFESKKKQEKIKNITDSLMD